MIRVKNPVQCGIKECLVLGNNIYSVRCLKTIKWEIQAVEILFNKTKTSRGVFYKDTNWDVAFKITIQDGVEVVVHTDDVKFITVINKFIQLREEERQWDGFY